MDYKEQLKGVRDQIDRIDTQLLQLFQERMEYVDDVAAIKSRANISLVDEKRENEIVDARTKDFEGAEKGEAAVFVRSLMGVSKTRQRRLLYGANSANEKLLPAPRKPICENVKVAFQGVKGAWSEVASVKMFPDAEHTAHEEWDDVFAAVKNKNVHYGVLPVENSQTGAIGEVYDLLRKYGCYIVGQIWVDVNHCLIGAQDASIDTIAQIYSHPQGFKQCGKFLRGRGWDLVACRNTAVAAEKVKTSKDSTIAAIGSERAAELNGLKVLSHDIVSDTTNKTRFIVIADTPQYDQNSDTVSVIFRTAHRSGALVDVLFPLMSENVNLSRLESRPLSDGKYCFFADIQGHIEDAKVISALKQADGSCGYLEILGCFKA